MKKKFLLLPPLFILFIFIGSRIINPLPTPQPAISIQELGAIGPDISGTGALVIDSNGHVLGSSISPRTPLLIIDNFQPDLKTISQNYVLALKILQKVDTISPSKVYGILEGSVLTATFINGPKIIIDIGDKVDGWYFPLQQVLERSKITSKSPSKIDVRFKSLVLTY